MKPTRLILGIIIIFLGILLLVSNLGYLNVNWEFFGKLWPAVLILWGLSILFGKSIVSWIFSTLALIVLILVIIAGAKTGWHAANQVVISGPTQSQNFKEPLDDIDKANLTLNSGAGTFSIGKTTDNLIETDVVSSIGEYELKESKNGKSADLILEPKGKNFSTGFGRAKNTIEIKLNKDPLWTINFHIGAASANLDLSEYSIEKATIEAGASSIDLRIGKKNTRTEVTVKAGASTVNINVPETSGVEVKASTGLSSRNFDGLSKVSDNTYKTDNFDTAINKIFIDLSTGVSSVNINRY